MNLLSSTLQHWLASCHLTEYEVDALPSDASFRRYFRLRRGEQSYIVMDASSERTSCLPFVAIANALRAHQLHTPDIIASDFLAGFLLISDFGDRLFLHQLNHANKTERYTLAIDALILLQRCQEVSGWPLPVFTEQFMRDELRLFQDWFLTKQMGWVPSTTLQHQLNRVFDYLAASAAKQPRVFMHRDYHSANLMLLPDETLGILDFQDAFMGPITYDLVSLLRDCYIDWPDQFVDENVKTFWQRLELPSVSLEEFRVWFDFMGMQRHMKALLTFSRKYQRDDNPQYLQYIPRTLQYLLSVSQRYSECLPLHRCLTEVKAQCAE